MDLDRVVATPVKLEGVIISELRDAWSLSAQSGTIHDRTGLQLDGELRPTSRNGVELRVPTRSGIDAAALLAACNGSPATTALVASMRRQ